MFNLTAFLEVRAQNNCFPEDVSWPEARWWAQGWDDCRDEPKLNGSSDNGAWNEELNVYLLGMNIMFMIGELFFLKSISKGEP